MRGRYPEFNAARPKFSHPASAMFRFSPFTCRSGYNGSARVTMLAMTALPDSPLMRVCVRTRAYFFFYFKIASELAVTIACTTQ